MDQNTKWKLTDAIASVNNVYFSNMDDFKNKIVNTFNLLFEIIEKQENRIKELEDRLKVEPPGPGRFSGI